MRRNDESDAGRVGTIELFFDLVFVVAVTQLSHTLATDLSITRMLQVSLLLLAVWWVWRGGPTDRDSGISGVSAR